MKEWTGAYVCHVCKKCNSAFVAEDYTNAQDIPPHWRYCPDCAKKLGIDYEKQKPWNNYSEVQKKRLEKLKEIGKENLKKYHQAKNKTSKNYNITFRFKAG